MIRRLLDSLVHRLRHHRWRFNLRKHFVALDRIRVEAPVFLLGTQGGGLTLLSRVLRRHPSAISVSGGADYWTGSDEMQNVLADALPSDLQLRGHPALKDRGLQESWLYATDELLASFRRTEDDATEEVAARLLSRMREFLLLHAGGEPGARFVDKSQSYTVKVSFVARLLKGHDPRFLLVTRNPYAVCRRAANKVLAEMSLSWSRRIELAVQHWENSMRCALEDGERVDGFGVVRFEDFLAEPREALAKIESTVGMELDPGLLPAPDDDMPLGTPPDGKWYPLRPNVNQQYLEGVPDEVVGRVEERCAGLVERFDYTPEGP